MESKSKSLIYALAAFAIIWSALLGCDKKTALTEDAAPIKIGHVSPLTGNQAETGIDQKRGAELAVAELNEAGGILGRKIELVAYDDKADPKEANSAATKLSADSAARVAASPGFKLVGSSNRSIYSREARARRANGRRNCGTACLGAAPLFQPDRPPPES